ncbi:FTR1 family iron permease [Cognatilysobacter lacus]|uniref:Iron permease n=1 Tax=Cognatilysobacter lacus TaxID=1643323 RepID=A0A5D8ZGP7_9GAMM|nr:FTR1 family protein [Lysobacter lacus]TZF91834.1 iron permease [Lysobacter lacus]
MLATAILVFREVLEAALIISIVCAATRGLAGRARWVSGGVALGVAGAIVLALAADRVSNAVEGMGQELLNAGILTAAVVMLAWHAIWMARHGRELARQMTSVGAAVAGGARPIRALMFVVAFAVLREGSEVVLFLLGMGASGTNAGAMAAGGVVGVAAGVAVGVALYRGLLGIPIRHFFTATNWMVLLLAAGLSSQAARYLIQADWLPALGDRVWDTSRLLSNESLAGQALRTLIGYDARPAGLQLLFYAMTALLIFIGMKTWGSTSPAIRPSAPR